MKKLRKIILESFLLISLLLIFLVLIFFNEVKAAEDEYFPPALGPTFGWKAGTNGITTPYGRKNGVSFNSIPDAGLAVYLPLSLEWNIGLNCDLIYNTHSFLMKYYYDGKKQEYKNKDVLGLVVSISPAFYYSD